MGNRTTKLGHPAEVSRRLDFNHLLAMIITHVYTAAAIHTLYVV